MADASRGPVSTMPGQSTEAPMGTMCDHPEHGDRPAVKRVQGETDSFGCEYHDFCQECYETHLAEVAKPVVDTCEWCRAENVEVIETRDIDEGMYGPVYMVCRKCRQKQRDDAMAELDSYDD